MLTVVYPLTVASHDFPVEVSAEISPDSESILILNFKSLRGEELCAAVLFTANTPMALDFEEDTALYPIFSPSAEVEVKFGYHVNTINRVNTFLAFITTTSSTGEKLTRVHGL